MSLSTWIRNLMSAMAHRNCRHDWAPSRGSGWVCVKCGRREDASTAVGDRPI